MTFAQKKTPGGQTRGIPNTHHSHHNGDTSSIADSVDRGEVFAQQLQGIYVVIAEIQMANGEQRFRRRYYAQLASAQLAVDRARMNGREAHLYIGQVTIVGGDAHD